MIVRVNEVEVNPSFTVKVMVWAPISESDTGLAVKMPPDIATFIKGLD